MKFNTANEYTKESRNRRFEGKKKLVNREYKMKDPSHHKSEVKHRHQIYRYMTEHE